MQFPSNEQMLKDLKGKIPAEMHSLMVEAGEFVDALERREFARSRLVAGPDGKLIVPKPRRYVQTSVTGN